MAKGLNHLEQMQDLALELGTHPKTTGKDPKTVRRKLALDLVALQSSTMQGSGISVPLSLIFLQGKGFYKQ